MTRRSFLSALVALIVGVFCWHKKPTKPVYGKPRGAIGVDVASGKDWTATMAKYSNLPELGDLLIVGGDHKIWAWDGKQMRKVT